MQYHFTTWPDHGVPEYATSMLAFHRKVFAEHKASKGPMVVHCRLVLLWFLPISSLSLYTHTHTHTQCYVIM